MTIWRGLPAGIAGQCGRRRYAWNSDTRPITIDSATVTYDALGRMVEQGNAGTYTEIQYAPTGFKMQLYNGQTPQNAFVPLPGGAVMAFPSTGPSPLCRHSDWLGSARFTSTYSTRTMYNDLAYAPFGEPYAQAGNTGITQIAFAGNSEDTTTNLYDAMYREYGIQGRWPSPDPAGLAAANPANPQSWNRYAYALNNPLSSIDPTGLSPMICRKPNSGSGPSVCPGASGGVGLGTNCSVDGIDEPCSLAMTMGGASLPVDTGSISGGGIPMPGQSNSTPEWIWLPSDTISANETDTLNGVKYGNGLGSSFDPGEWAIIWLPDGLPQAPTLPNGTGNYQAPPRIPSHPLKAIPPVQNPALLGCKALFAADFLYQASEGWETIADPWIGGLYYGAISLHYYGALRKCNATYGP